MIEPHSNRLRVGAYDIDVARRATTSRIDGATGKLTVKALQVLLVLIEADGKVVSRETLLARVWPDTMPTDDVLTQAVAQLRRTFCDDRDAPRYVETIARGGYSLVADFEWLRADGAGENAIGTTSSRPEALPASTWRSSGMQRGMAVVVALAVVVVVLGWMATRRDRIPTDHARDAAAEVPVRMDYKAITSLPGQERWPSLSPDGSTVAFVQASQDGGRSTIMLQPTEHMSARPLTSPPPDGRDQMPVWSRDGREIAFVRSSPRDCTIMVVAASGGEERKVGDCYLRSFSLFDWAPDDRGLLMGGIRDSAESNAPLRLLDLSTGQWQALEYAIADDDVDLFPRYSPDGKWIVFRRNISLADLWLMPAEGGEPRRLTDLRGDIRGMDWLPDGSGVVFSLVKSEVGLFRYTIADGALVPLQSLPAGNPVFPDVAANHWSMVFEIDQLRSGIFRIPLGADPAHPPPREQVFASSGTDLLASISPDGGTLAFLSDRAMSLQLWIGEIDHPHTLRAIDGILPVPRHAPVWSQDGRRLLVVGKTDDGDRLFEVEVGSDRVRKLPVPDAEPAYATYTGTADRLLVGIDGGEGRLRLVLYALPDWLALASIDDVALARYDEHGDQVYFTRPSRRGLWRADAGLGDVTLSAAGLPHPSHYRQWAIVAGKAYYSGPSPGCQAMWQRMDDEDGGRCLVREAGATVGSPGVDRAGDWIHVGLPVAQNIDVGWARLPQASPAPANGEGTMH